MLRFFLIFPILFLSKETVFAQRPPIDIAIIGGGIGGTSTAYFVRQIFGDSVNIRIHEKESRLCGRLNTVHIAGRDYESGGSIIHPKNKYMKMFQQTLPGLEVADGRSGFLGIFDGNDYMFKSSTWSVATLFKMLWKFGLSLIRIFFIEKKFLTDFNRIYELQDKGMAFENTEAFFHAMGDEYAHVTEGTAESYFSKKFVSDFTINNLISPGIRVNYGQDAGVNAFVGAVSMAGLEPGLWSVKGGNKQVCDKLVSNARARVTYTSITAVGRNSNGKFELFEGNYSSSYDIVFLAAPVGGNMYHIDVSHACESPPPSFKGKEYRRTVANFIKGKLNSKLFQCDGVASCPSTILTNQELFYRSIGYHMPVDYEPTEGADVGVYKVFSTEPLTEAQKDHLFESRTEGATVDWKAYPLYRPPDIPGTFVLNSNGFYYTSPIEWAASAMEMSAISAKNAVLLAYNNWFKKDHSDTISKEKKAEL